MSTQSTSSHHKSSKSTVTYTNRVTADSPYHRRRYRSPYPIPEFYSEDIEDDFHDQDIDNRQFLSQQVQQKNHTRKATCQVTGFGQSPATKRKYDDANLVDILIEKIDNLTDEVSDLKKKCEDSVDEIRKLRKNNEKLEKTTYALAQSYKHDVVPNETAEEPPIVLYEGKNLLAGMLPPTPTALLCKLIRQLYSIDEIVEGIQDGPRLDSIKRAVCASFYGNDSIKFDVFWKTHGIKCYQGQKRSQKHRDKKNRLTEEGQAALINNEN